MKLTVDLDSLAGKTHVPASEKADAASDLAERLLRRSHELLTPAERRQQAELHRMISLPEDKSTLVQMTDQAFRTHRNGRIADQLTHILDLQGIPRFFSPLDRAMLRGFQSFGGYLPGVSVPLVKDKMRKETANVILPAEPDVLKTHLRDRWDQGVRMNVNFLGEALLGEDEAESRLKMYLGALQIPEVECISVKISTIYSQISPLAWEHTLSILGDRMELLYRAAAREVFKRPDGSEVPKFVYLDMEEYRDMHLTADTLRQTLDRDGLQNVHAGIALQAYVPDSYEVLVELLDWAKARVAAGGAPLTVRIVKGANMEMERVEASLMGWPQAPYQVKVDTDANYKRMVQLALAAENAGVLRVGIASHNLFDLAWSLITAHMQGTIGNVQFEMLEGMANHQRRALFEIAENLLLYAPACRKEDFLHAIGYLIRRLDENTGEENFLRHTFEIQPGSEAWKKLEAGFKDSIERMEDVSSSPRRTQDRNLPPCQPPVPESIDDFRNEPDTDFSLRQNVRWAQTEIYDAWRDRCGDQATHLRCFGDGTEDVHEAQHGQDRERQVYESTDPSRPGVVVCRYELGDEADIDRAIQVGRDDPTGWRLLAPEQRYDLLRKVAHRIRERRADLMGAGLADGGKTIAESDPEVSEAVDFVEFYALSAKLLQEAPELDCRPRGLVVVVSPWNFPIAIPCGGVAAALAAGNTVILKPASDTVLPAAIICECFWEAGVPREALQLVPCRGGGPGKRLVSHDDVDVVILTGGTETAVEMLRQKPDLDLLAETGGKNATIVSGLSDRDLAIKHLLHSAFSHGGQKCSATSLLILQEEVFEDEHFKGLLCDAVRSLRVGSAWDPATKMGPLIRPPRGELARGLKELEPGESWAVMPRHQAGNDSLWSPGVKWNVREGSFTHKTELFGPVLAVMKYRHLDDAIDLVNATGFGLTSGLESLDDREQAEWMDAIKAGNLYINRSTTGAIVMRQPFGGMGKSAFGPGIKAGGPNYVIPLMHIREQTIPRHDEQSSSVPDSIGTDELPRVRAAEASIREWAAREFKVNNDPMRLVGQDNFRRYLPMTHVRIRIDDSVSRADLWIMAMASAAVGAGPTVGGVDGAHAASPIGGGNTIDAGTKIGAGATISYPPGQCQELLQWFDEAWDEGRGTIEMVAESQAELASHIRDGQVDRLRWAAGESIEPGVREASNAQQIYVAAAPVLASGRIEPLWYLREQAISVDYHRYGNLGPRTGEKRRPVA
ncbi:MAG: bifunctional proline dehydrogenase/L-glutamate gamma-semialdehyde dehydrogenase [Planctomycetota bacterium]